MAEININPAEMVAKQEKRANPRVEELKASLRLLYKNRLALVGLIIVAIYYFIMVLDFAYPPWLGVPNLNSIYVFTRTYGIVQTPISPFVLSNGLPYILGGTQYNIALLPAMLGALRFDLGVSTLVVAIGAAVGITVGTVSAYLGGVVDEIIMRVTDIFFSIPFLVLAVAVTALVAHGAGGGLNGLILALIIVWWPIYARLSRSLALSTKSLNFVEAARAAGSSKARNIFVHIMPNVLSPAFVQMSLDIGSVVLIFATLFFLGVIPISALSAPPELGVLINYSVGQAGYASNLFFLGFWWTFLFPGLFLLVFTVAANLLGDGLRDILDPKLRR